MTPTARSNRIIGSGISSLAIPKKLTSRGLAIRLGPDSSSLLAASESESPLITGVTVVSSRGHPSFTNSWERSFKILPDYSGGRNATDDRQDLNRNAYRRSRCKRSAHWHYRINIIIM